MEKYFCNYNQSLALKELGFEEPCFGWYHPKGNIIYAITKDKDSIVNAPLKSQVFEWARKQGYDTKVEKESEGLYFGFYWTGAAWIIVGNGSYEEAESACIDKLIELLQHDK